MKVLVGSGWLGPMAVFLPDGTHAEVPSAEDMIAPLLAQVAARGIHSTFEQHAKVLAAGPGYAGKWRLEQMPDGISAPQALHYARYRSAGEIFSGKPADKG